MRCWDCHWGWPRAVHDIYQRALDKLDGKDSSLHFGPAHIVWEDENWDSAEWCIQHFDEYADDLNQHEREVVMQSLLELNALPESVRDVCPEDYDGEHPELYPPPLGVEMVRHD